ncbi:hypothetical protein GCM10020000_75480 [Streptomyces olivoverticillatus]
MPTSRNRVPTASPPPSRSSPTWLSRVAADFPQLRSRRIGADKLRVFDHVDLGIACATDDGDLTVGVVRGADLLDG